MKNYILIIGFVVLGGVNLFLLKSYSQNKAAIDLVHTEINKIKEENERWRQIVILNLSSKSRDLDRKFEQLEANIKRDIEVNARNIGTIKLEATNAYSAARKVSGRLDDLEEQVSDALTSSDLPFGAFSLKDALQDIKNVALFSDALTSSDLPFGAFSLKDAFDNLESKINAFNDLESKINALSRKVFYLHNP